jgi:predicted ATP-grasp superfamily ATP-dependent carboligase
MNKSQLRKITECDQSLPVIIDANWVTAIGVIRSLALEDIPSISLTRRKFGLGRYSNQTIGLVCPDYQIFPERFLEFMVDLGKHLKKPGIIMPTDDLVLERLMQFDEELSPYYLKTFPEPKILGNAMNKYNQYLAAKSIGLPVPYSIAPDNESDLDAWPKDFFPCVVKGRKGKYFFEHFNVQAILIQNYAGLQNIYRQSMGIPLIIQDFIPGDDNELYAYTSFISQTGECLTEFTSHKTQQVPARLGILRRGKSKSIPELRDQSRLLLKKLNFKGFSYIEYKLDSRDGQYKLIEINARFWKNFFMATLAGINFPYIAYLSNIRSSIPKHKKQKEGVEWVFWIEEILYLLMDLFTKKTRLKDWFKDRPKGKDVIFGWKDPLPVFMIPLYMIQKFCKNSRILKKFFD